jgi:hypothetical protein
MNIYEQLQAVRSDLMERDAKAKSIRIIDSMIAKAEPQRDSGINFSRLHVLRRVMQMPEVLNDEEVRLDFLALEGDLEDAAARRAPVETNAYEETDRRPKLKKYYKRK